jgi:hypothetical protein
VHNKGKLPIKLETISGRMKKSNKPEEKQTKIKEYTRIPA